VGMLLSLNIESYLAKSLSFHKKIIKLTAYEIIINLNKYS